MSPLQVLRSPLFGWPWLSGKPCILELSGHRRRWQVRAGDDMTLGRCSRLPRAPSWLLTSPIWLSSGLSAARWFSFADQAPAAPWSAPPDPTVDVRPTGTKCTCIVEQDWKGTLSKAGTGGKRTKWGLAAWKADDSQGKEMQWSDKMWLKPGTGMEETGRGFLHLLQRLTLKMPAYWTFFPSCSLVHSRQWINRPVVNVNYDMSMQCNVKKQLTSVL